MDDHGGSRPASSPSQPAAGWYPTEAGLRWWDGRAWGPLAPTGPQPLDDANRRLLAFVSHLGFLLFYFVVPFVIRLTAGKRDEYVRHHSTEALNFMLLVWVVGTGLGATVLLRMLFATPAELDSGLPAWFGLLWLLSAAVGLGAFVLSIVGAVKAYRGVWWRYPVNIRVVRGARRRAPDGAPPASTAA